VKADLAVARRDVDDAVAVLQWFRDTMQWQGRLEIVHLEQMRADMNASVDEMKARIHASGPTEPFKGTLDELYTAPKISRD
jgi:hypothetical protein